MPGTQLAARLQDLNYRVQTFSDAAQISAAAESEGPMLVFVDLRSHRTDVPGLINQIRQRPTTAHIPVVAFPMETETGQVQHAGATMVVSEAVLLGQLGQVLE